MVLLNLVLADFIIAGYGVPVDFKATIDLGWKSGRPLCYATGFILTTAGK